VRHGGKVHSKGIVTISAKAVSNTYQDDPRTLANPVSKWCFNTSDGPGQWICWHFHELRARPTHYTIRRRLLRSWVLETSLDYVNWTEIDRKADNRDFGGSETASFSVSNSGECRFIRQQSCWEQFDVHYCSGVLRGSCRMWIINVQIIADLKTSPKTESLVLRNENLPARLRIWTTTLKPNHI
jgi:hypothetical protein